MKRKQKARESRSSTIIYSLNTVINSFNSKVDVSKNEASKNLKENIMWIVHEISKTSVLTSWLVNMYLSDLTSEEIIKNKEEIIKNKVVDITDGNQTLFRNAMSIIRDLHTNKDILKNSSYPRLVKFAQEKFKPLFPSDFVWPKTANTMSSFDYLAIEMETNHKIYMDIGIHQHIIYCIKVCSNSTKKIVQSLWNSVLKKENPIFNMYMSTVHAYYLSSEIFDLYEIHPILALKKCLQLIEQRQNDQTLPPLTKTGHLFTLTPIRTIKNQFVVIGKKHLKSWGFVESDMNLFFPKRGQGEKQWEAGAQIKTDGTRVSLTYTRNKSVGMNNENISTRQTKLSKNKTDKIDVTKANKGIFNLNQLECINPETVDWEAFDPGMTTLYHGHKGTKLSRKQWRSEIRANHTTNIGNKRNQKIKSILDELSTFSLKKSDISESVRKYVAHWETLWTHFGHPWWARHRFRSYGHKHKVLDEIVNDVLGKDHKKIAVFGDGVFASSMKGMSPAPMTMIRDYIARFGRVVLVDEYLTSQVCSGCHKRMEQSKVEHGVFHCKSDCCKLKTTWDRDENASQNIAHIFVEHMKGNIRPEYFQRDNDLTSKKAMKHKVGRMVDPKMSTVN